MSGFTKLFNSILMSSIWQEDDATRLVWITLLASANRRGEVEASPVGLAHAARVSLEHCMEALEKFQRPDPMSRSDEFDGRRLEKVPGGYRLLNYEKYRNTLDASERREYQRVKQAEYRAKRGGRSTAIERLAQRARSPEELARIEELASGVPAGALGSYGPEAMAVVNQKTSLSAKSLPVDGDMPDPDGAGGFPEV